MKTIYSKIKKGLIILMMMLCVALVSQQAAVPAYAYTQEEIDAAKAWLSAHGYSPDMGGAQAAYNDYMNGKFGAIPGLPEPNVKPETPPAEEPVVEEPVKEEPEEKPEKPEKEPEEEPDDGATETPQVKPGEDPVEETEEDSGEETDTEDDDTTEETSDSEETELLEPDPEQQEFSDMITVFASGFSESDQEKIDEAQQRLEKQRQERAQAEKEAETMVIAKHNPQRQVIILFCVILAVAAIGLVVLLVKSKKKD